MNIKRLTTLVVSLAFVTSVAAQNVATTKVQQVELDTKIVINGHVEAVSESTVSSQVNAKVKMIYVDVDDKVTAGKVLVELDDTELKAQLAQAKAALNVAQAQASQAQSEYKRLLGLKKESFVSDNDMTKAKSALDIANANINLANAQIAQVTQMLTYTVIKAPYSGVVTARHVEVGETANFGQPLLTGFALNQNRLFVHVPNSLIEQVEQSQQILAMDKSGNWQSLSNIIIAPNADVNTHTVMVRANISKDSFKQRPGSFIKVAVSAEPRTALTVPSTAVFSQGDLTAVYVQAGEKYVLRQVVTGKAADDKTEVLSGLSIDDVVVVNGADYLALVR